MKLNKLTFFDKLIKKSILIENVYGHGETYSTIYAALTGKNIYKNHCDAWFIEDSFKDFSDLGKIFKEKAFTNIYLRNASPNNDLGNFYGRFLGSISNNFDYKYLQRPKKNHNFTNYLKEKNLIKSLKNKNKNFFILIHDYTLHDSREAYNGDHKKILDVINNKLTKNFKKTLSNISYNSKKDNLIVLSDHGLTKYPESKLYTSSITDKKEYDKYYKNIFLDEKIKMLFFIKPPNLKKKITINKNYYANNIHFILKSFFQNKNKIEKFINIIKKNSPKFLITSVRSTRATIYENYFEKINFHNHIIYIKGKRKIIYSNKHPNKFIIEKNNKFLKINKELIDQKFKIWIDNYFSLSNKIKRYLLFGKYKIKRLFNN